MIILESLLRSQKLERYSYLYEYFEFVRYVTCIFIQISSIGRPASIDSIDIVFREISPDPSTPLAAAS